MNVTRLEDNQSIQDYALASFHATTHAFNMTPTVKIIENHAGKRFIRQVHTTLTIMRPQMPMAVPAPQDPLQPPANP
jgi:hypothetical protein